MEKRLQPYAIAEDENDGNDKNRDANGNQSISVRDKDGENDTGGNGNDNTEESGDTETDRPQSMVTGSLPRIDQPGDAAGVTANVTSDDPVGDNTNGAQVCLPADILRTVN